MKNGFTDLTKKLLPRYPGNLKTQRLLYTLNYVQISSFSVQLLKIKEKFQVVNIAIIEQAIQAVIIRYAM